MGRSRDSIPNARLHGTYLSPALTRRQRPIDEVPQQQLLQDKLQSSRLYQLYSVIRHRPSNRDKSAVEKAALFVLWPSACVMLALAIAVSVHPTF
jgi:hypothetical protein